MTLPYKEMIILSMVLPVVGCTAPSNYLDAPSNFLDAPEDCPDANPGPVTIVIRYEDGKINVPQDPQIVVQGDVIQFILRGKDRVLVSTSGKEAAAGWLNGSGKKNSQRPDTARFLVCVPRDLFDDEPPHVTRKEYAYNVDAAGGGETWVRLDPIVIVDK